MKNVQGRTMRQVRKLEEAAVNESMRQALSELSKEDQTIAVAVLKDMDQDLPGTMDDATYAVVSDEYLAKLPDNQRIPRRS